MLFKNNRKKGARITKGNNLYILEYVWFETDEDIQRKHNLNILNEKIRVRDLERLNSKKAK